MPSYNCGPFLRTAITSVLSNNSPTLELLIQDGQSTDETMEVVASCTDPRLSLVSEPDAGQSDAVNRAIERPEETGSSGSMPMTRSRRMALVSSGTL